MSDKMQKTKNVKADKPRASKPKAEKSRSDKPRSDKSRTEKSRTEKSRTEKPRSEKPRSEKLRSEKQKAAKPQAEKSKTEKSKNDASKTEKLQKILANAGHGSRREIEVFIQEGRISIDGKIATLGDRIDVNSCGKIRFDGRILGIKDAQKSICRVLAYYKPEGELCTRSDPEGRPTVFDRLPKVQGARWVAVGRLDVNTSGLLLFTTDGELANRLMHPSREVEREYAVRVFGEIDDAKIAQLQKGIQLEDGPASFKTVKFRGGEGINQWYNVTLTEGRNREVRRLWEAVGVQVSRLIRVRYGDLDLPKGLPRGGWTELNLENTNYLRELVGLPLEDESKVSVESDKRRIKANQIRRAVKRHSQPLASAANKRTPSQRQRLGTGSTVSKAKKR